MQQQLGQRHGVPVSRAIQTPSLSSYNGSSLQYTQAALNNRTSPLSTLKNLSPTLNAAQHTNNFKTEKLVQPITSSVPNCTKELNLPLASANPDLDVSEEELHHILSQKDLATTLAENLLKHFGSDDIEHAKEESVLSSGIYHKD